MSSIFERGERVRRLRQMFSYFRNAAVLTGAEIRDAATQENKKDREEWLGLLSEVRSCLLAMEAIAREASEVGETINSKAKADRHPASLALH